MDAHGIRRQCLLRVEDGWQRLVLHLDQGQGLLGDGLTLRSDERHPVPYKAHLVVERKGIKGAGDGIGLPGRGVHHARDVLPGEHCRHTRQLPGPGRVNALDASVRMRAVEHLGMQHPAHLDICRKSRLALDELNASTFGSGCPIVVRLLVAWRNLDFRHDRNLEHPSTSRLDLSRDHCHPPAGRTGPEEQASGLQSDPPLPRA